MKLRTLILCLLCVLTARAQNFSNRGKEFWVGYGQNQLFGAANAPNSQNMVLYLTSGAQPATVRVSISNTTWVKTYTIAANSVVVTDLIPKTGPEDCRILSEGLYRKAVHVESDVPIVVYAHTYGQYTSGGTMLLPVESYSYTYFSVNPEQSAADSYSWFYIVAGEDNTSVKITPSRPTTAGRPANVAFTVNLKKGEVYNVMGAVNGNSGYDVSGSRIQSVPGVDGNCHPVGVFSGTSRTVICSVDPLASSDFVMQQVFPINAWGSKYITALTSRSTSPSALNNNKYRIYIREPNTLVRKNGVLMTGLINNFFYDYLSTTADVITSTKPILVAQFIPSADGCGTQGLGDPEMFCLSPVEQSINDVVFYNTDKEAIAVNYLTMVIPQNGLASLRIDGSNQFDYTYPHPNAPGYSVVVKQMPLSAMQHRAVSDSAFTAITYGLGQYESYGYNAGTMLRNLEAVVQVKNKYGNGITDYTCPNTPFRAVLKTTYRPSSILWKLSSVPGLAPNADVTLTNYPAPSDSVIEFQRKFYLYELPGDYTFAAQGTYTIPVTITDLLIENCSFSNTVNIPVNVLPGPSAAISLGAGNCVGDSILFAGVSTGSTATTKWGWDFGDGTTDSLKMLQKSYAVAGTYPVQLTVIRTDGCLGRRDTIVNINALPKAAFSLRDSVVCMPNGSTWFVNTSTSTVNAALNYQWNFGDNSSSVLRDPAHAYATAASYNVSLKVTDALGCRDSVSRLVNNFALRPVAAFSPADTVVCAGGQVSLRNMSLTTGAALTYRWQVDARVVSQADSAQYTFTQPGTYRVELMIKNEQGCTDSLLRLFEVKALPMVDAGSGSTVPPGSSVVLNGSINNPAAQFSWSPLAGLTLATTLKPVTTPANSQWYYLKVTDQNSCSAVDSVFIKVLQKLQVPNAFSPNGDGINDRWVMAALADYPGALVEIFNRHGQKVYSSSALNVSWPGTFNGKPLPVGTYYYMINTFSQAGGKFTGSVTLLR